MWGKVDFVYTVFVSALNKTVHGVLYHNDVIFVKTFFFFFLARCQAEIVLVLLPLIRKSG